MKVCVDPQTQREIEQDPETGMYVFKGTKIIWCPVGMQEQSEESINYWKWRNSRIKILRKAVRKMFFIHKLKRMMKCMRLK